MSRPVAAGDTVRCHVPGRRSFRSVVLAVRDDSTVDVTEPRNGGRRTLRPEQVRRVPRRRAAKAVVAVAAESVMVTGVVLFALLNARTGGADQHRPAPVRPDATTTTTTVPGWHRLPTATPHGATVCLGNECFDVDGNGYPYGPPVRTDPTGRRQ